MLDWRELKAKLKEFPFLRGMCNFRITESIKVACVDENLLGMKPEPQTEHVFSCIDYFAIDGMKGEKGTHELSSDSATIGQQLEEKSLWPDYIVKMKYKHRFYPEESEIYITIYKMKDFDLAEYCSGQASKKASVSELLIWWLAQYDCERVLTVKPEESLPFYILDELKSCYGICSRGRLWVPPDVQLEEIEWDNTKPMAHLASQAAGIVIKEEDARFLVSLPGFVTDLKLNLWIPKR